jgi:outer membrane lipoprotein SlyB
VPIGGILSGFIGAIDGGVIGHIVGEQMGEISRVLEQIGVTVPFTHWQVQAADAGMLFTMRNVSAMRRSRIIEKVF